MRLPAVTCRRLFIFGPCERGKKVEEENFSLGRLRVLGLWRNYKDIAGTCASTR